MNKRTSLKAIILTLILFVLISKIISITNEHFIIINCGAGILVFSAIISIVFFHDN